MSDDQYLTQPAFAEHTRSKLLEQLFLYTDPEFYLKQTPAKFIALNSDQ